MTGTTRPEFVSLGPAPGSLAARRRHELFEQPQVIQQLAAPGLEAGHPLRRRVPDLAERPKGAEGSATTSRRPRDGSGP